MCTIGLAPPHIEVSGNKFRKCFRANPDGGGFAYIDSEGVLQIEKGYLWVKDMLADYRAAFKAYPESPFLLHWRIATQGAISEMNSHPFQVRDDLAMAHNGHISGMQHKKKSDTLMFALSILRHLPDRFEDNEAIMELLRDRLLSDKMVLLRSDRKFCIINEGLGEWSKDGIWFSNAAYRRISPWGKKVSSLHDRGSLNYNASSSSSSRRWTADERKAYEDVWGELAVFEGDSCLMCHKTLDLYDSEICLEVGAAGALCYDCIVEEGTQLLDWDMIRRPLDEFDYDPPEKGEEHVH